ncbi:cytochrome c4 [Solimonas sp. K1W22B-7]|uniref:c-type cytochrome n=1 Tax=Solimonas sp. K1W22B-7 TaxID=2303331 RepID=UPI000E331221|nr:c-type cytochrome [Solimonas sp. K1W22B-7]AXQ29405.1 cytochrome c4 [Solimonas sp. K1W22B-7]
MSRIPRFVLLASLLLWGSAQAAPPEDSIAQRLLPCAACHGAEGRATSDGFYPRIAGKPAGYLYHQLLNFREGRRLNAQMSYLLERQSDAYLREMAQYFSALSLPYPAPQPTQADAARLQHGLQLVRQGDAARGVPACNDCHGQKMTGVAPDIPGLLGLPYDYLVAQFGAWREGTRHGKAPDCMAAITARLSPEDIGAVAAWLAAQPMPADPHPAASLPQALPLDCGSVGSKEGVQ